MLSFVGTTIKYFIFINFFEVYIHFAKSKV